MRAVWPMMAWLALADCATPAWAYWCSEPSEPSCMMYGKPDSYCEHEVRRYVNEERDYRQCVKDDANQKIDESVERANRIVQRWNCHASGSSYCF